MLQNIEANTWIGYCAHRRFWSKDNTNKNINNFRVHVLQGVTGSGKTLVYFETIRKVIRKKKTSTNSSSRDWINKPV